MVYYRQQKGRQKAQETTKDQPTYKQGKAKKQKDRTRNRKDTPMY